MNTKDGIQYIERLKEVIIGKGYPFKYSEFCTDHKPVGTIFKKNKMHRLYPVLQSKDTYQVILYMNQYGNHITTRGKEGLPIYRLFGFLHPLKS
jgi:hypothetical protein